MINDILDTIISEDKILKMPSASKVNFDLYVSKYNINDVTKNFILEINSLCEIYFLKSFNELNSNEKINVLNKLKVKNIKLYLLFMKNVFNCYYSNSKVLAQIEINNKNFLKKYSQNFNNEDWSILLPVKNRGEMFKKTNKN